MAQTRTQKTQRRIQCVFGLALVGLLYAEFSHQDHEPVLTQRSALVLAGPQNPADPFERLLRDDPLEALIELRHDHIQGVKDYQCSLVKQELLPSGLSAEQEINVSFRQEPFSVAMHWVRNAGLANRVLYVKGRWIDPSAKRPELAPLAKCQPGAIAKLFLKSITMPIHGSTAKKVARRSIDEFGFARTLDLLIKYCKIAESRGELSLEFKGETHFDGRPVWVLVRRLPFDGDASLYPDRTAEIFIDKEYRIPVAVYCYSDDARKPDKLLGKYEYRDIRFNVGLTDAVFDPDTYGM